MIKEKKGWGTTPELYQFAQDINVALVETKKFPLFQVKKPLSVREWLPLMGITIPASLIPGNIIAPITEELSLEEVTELIEWRIISSLSQEIAREERYSLRSEKKRPWSIRTRRPFRGKIDKVEITFRDRIELAEKVARELGAPYNSTSKKGRPPLYDGIKMASAILVKGMLSFVDLSTELKNIAYDPTEDGRKKYPCSSELHVIFQKIPNEWLETALRRLDDLSVKEFSKFEEKLDVFVIDGSALSGKELVEREVLTVTRLIRDYFEYQAIIRTTTNTIRGVKGKSNKIADVLYLLSQDSTVTADPEFDVEDNYINAEEAHIDLHVKQKKGGVRKSRRKKARRCFDKIIYGKRKLGERPFGNIEVRRTKCYFKKPENRLKGAILIACDHNITLISITKPGAICS